MKFWWLKVIFYLARDFHCKWFNKPGDLTASRLESHTCSVKINTIKWNLWKWIKPLGIQGGYLNLPLHEELWEGRTITDMSRSSFNYNGYYLYLYFVPIYREFGKAKTKIQIAHLMMESSRKYKHEKNKQTNQGTRSNRTEMIQSVWSTQLLIVLQICFWGFPYLVKKGKWRKSSNSYTWKGNTCIS